MPERLPPAIYLVGPAYAGTTLEIAQLALVLALCMQGLKDEEKVGLWTA